MSSLSERLCTWCELHTQCRSNNLSGDGPITGVDVLLVGEGPGREEDRRGKVWCGPTGGFLRATVNRYSHFVEKRLGRKPVVRYTNATRCFSGELSPREGLNACRPHLEREIEKVQPRRIITLGALALNSVVDPTLGVMEHVEGWTRVKVNGSKIPVQFLMHPSATLHNRSIRPTWLRQFGRAFLNRPDDSLADAETFVVHTVNSIEGALAVFQKAAMAESVGFDTEYNKATGRILCYALSFTDNEAYAFPEELILNQRVIDGLTELFRSGKCDFVAHNWKFDAHVVVEALGVPEDEFMNTRHPWVDTSSLSTIYDAERRSALEYAEWLVGLGGHKDRMRDLLGKFSSARSPGGPAYEKAYDHDPATVLWYCGGDAIATRRLRKWFFSVFEEEKVTGAWTETMGPVGPVLFSMERDGVQIDREAQLDLDNRLESLLSIQTEAIRSHSAVKLLRGRDAFANKSKKDVEFNPASNHHLRELFFSSDGLGFTSEKLTASGVASTDAETRKSFAEHPLVQRIDEFTRLSKLRGTYVKGWAKCVDDVGLLHPSYRQDVARTGRLSARAPNIQTIPRAYRGPEALLLRKLIIPHIPQRVSDRFARYSSGDLLLLEVDFSQVELRQTAQDSGDPELLRCYKERADLHIRTAAFIAGISESEVSDEQRTAAKVPNFGQRIQAEEKSTQNVGKPLRGNPVLCRQA